MDFDPWRLMCMLAVFGQKKIDESPVSTTVEGDMVWTSRFMEKLFYWHRRSGRQVASQAMELAEWCAGWSLQICRFTPPSSCDDLMWCRTLLEMAVLIAPSALKKAAVPGLISLHQKQETFYLVFLGDMARNFKPETNVNGTLFCEGKGKIFSEDLEYGSVNSQNLLLFQTMIY